MATLERRWRARVAAAVAASVLLGLVWGCATSQAYQNGNKAAKAGDWDLAVTYYRKAVQGAPDRSDYKIVLERATLAASRHHIADGQKFEREEQLDFALRSYRKSLDYDGANQEVRAKIQVLEQTLRDRIEASRPRPPIEAMREKARQAMAEPILNPASRDPLKIKFANQQLRDILNFVGSATGINVAFDRDYQDKQYSVDLDGVTLEQALHQILTANQLFFKVLNERTIIVVPETQPKRLAYEEQAIRTFYLSHTDPTEMVQLLNTVVRLQQPIQPVFGANKNNNTVTVRATIPMLQIIERVIEANDRPRAEVIIDVEILEVNRDRAKQYGLELSQYAVGLAFSPEGKPATGSGGEGGSTGNIFNLNTVSAGISAADFYASVPSAAIKFLESDSETKVVAKPQLRGSEGEKLTLNLGTEVPVPSTTFTPIATGGTAYNPLTSFQYKTVGVNVEIEPRVTYEGDVVMKLSIEVSAQAGDKNIAGQNLPSFGTRKATTRLRLRDGESNLLAGLLQEVERKAIKGVPGLIHVPILKDLFASNDNRIEQTDIVMLLTPHIVRTHELTQKDFSPIYIGTQQSLGLTGAPPLIAAPGGGETEAAAPAAPAAAPSAPGAPRPNPAPPAAGSPVPAPPGSTTVPVVPPGSSPVPGTVGMAPTPPAAVPQPAGTAAPPAAVPEPAPPAAQPAAPPAAGPPAMISAATPGTDLMVAGGPYTVPIAITNASRLSTVTVSLSYNPRVLKVRLVQEGSFMRQGGVTVQFAQHVDDQTGRVDVTFTRVSDTVGASGAGMLAAIVFDAVSTGTSPLTVNGAAMGPAGSAVNLAFQPTTVTVR